MANAGDAESRQANEIALAIARYQPDAQRVARRLVRSDAEAEDLAQTAILNALRRAQHIQDTQHVKAYVLTAVRNLWRNQLRQQGKRRFVGADAAEYLPANELGPEERALTNLDAAVARAGFSSLSRRSQEVLLLRYVEGLNYSELGQTLGISTVAARQRAHRARDELVGACIDQTASPGVGRCSAVRGRLGRYLRGRLPQRARDDIAEHLQQCAQCGECLAQLKDLYGHGLGRRERSE
ncbi:MAG TPA: sigma-70 family RNA polymerase sigma factor [Acidimicrobiia bacterium]|jgi:RNA polymerase sigma-70 factor (ECF subfamily)